MNRKFHLKNSPALAAASLLVGVALAVGGTVFATAIGTDLTVTGVSTLTGAVTASGALTVTGASTLTGAVTASSDISVTSGVRVGADATPGHLTALADDSLFVEGEAEYDGIVWFDGSLRASSTLLVTGATTHVGTTKVGESGTALTQVLTGYVDCGPIAGSQSIAATSTGTIGCTNGFSNVSANDAVFLTATTTVIIGQTGAGTVLYTGKASTTAANRVQAEMFNMTGTAWTVTTSTWRYLIIR